MKQYSVALDDALAADLDAFVTEQGLRTAAVLREVIATGLRVLHRTSVSARAHARAEMIREERHAVREAFARAVEQLYSAHPDGLRDDPRASGLSGVRGRRQPGRPRKGS